MGVSDSIISYSKKLYMNLINKLGLLFNYIFYHLYDKTPKQVGDIDENLMKDINDGIEYFIIRFKSFNKTLNFFLKYNLLSILVAAVVFLASFMIFLPVQILDLPQNTLINNVIFIPIALIILVGLVLIVAANAYIILNVAALVWFSFQKVRNSLLDQTDTNDSYDEKYWCKISKGPERYSFNKIEVYQKNLNRFYHIAVYIVIGYFLLIFGSTLPNLIDSMTRMVENLVLSGQIQIPFADFLNVLIDVVDSLTPINIKTFLVIENFTVLLYFIGMLLFFSAFMHFKNINQHSNLSDLNWSKIDKYSVIKEYRRAEKIILVANYQYAKRIDQHRLRILLKELIKTPISILVLVTLTIVYTNIFVL